MKNPETVSEKVLMRRARDGDRDAFARVVRLHRAEAYRVAIGYMGNEDDAREIVQEAFLKALRYIHRFDVERPFFPWFYRILRNLSFNLLAKRKRHGECPLKCESDGGIDPRSSGRNPFQDLVATERVEVLWDAVRDLSEEHREIILLRHFRDRSYDEIAEILDIPRGTVMSRLFYARASLKQAIDRRLGAESKSLGTSPEEN
ncbi:MAG: sigma-70 family RNA polymerase sigma factor [bacterium]|nr:sigma-70 family RNA polymerase sigma factor [bacterium]